jgi:small subunit ribosomal protein S7
MESGKKSLSSRILYDALKTIEERTGQDPLETFERAVRNATPLVEVKARRVGGATYQVPMEVRSERGVALALRWLVRFSRQRPGRSMVNKLANELMDAANETGNTIRKREETHRMAEANKAFAHYRY